jgi:hypothetical protein
MTELLAAAPRLWRVLRPLCRMLGITPHAARRRQTPRPPGARRRQQAPAPAGAGAPNFARPSTRRSAATARRTTGRRFSAPRPGRRTRVLFVAM